MTHIFFSHTTQDDDFVTHLAANLREMGVQTWVDHENIKPSQDWDAEVQAALEATDAMILVLSSRSTKSLNVKVEWSFFLDLGKPIYPVLLEDCEIPFRLRLYQHVDFTGDEDQALEKLLAALRGRRGERRAVKRAGKKPAGHEPITLKTARQIDTLLVLSGHRDSVKGVAFSPDGGLLASGADDKNVRLWYTTRRTRIKMLIGHEKPVNDVVFSPDGATLASASDDRTVRLWNVAKRYGITALAGHTGGVTGLAYSPDGTKLASASEDGTVRLWNPANRKKPLAVLAGHAGPVNGVAFSPDGKMLASSGLDQTVRLWSVAERRETAVTEIEQEARRMVFSPDGGLLALGLNGSGVLVLDVNTQARAGAIYYADYNANCVRGVAFSPGGALLAMASLDGNIRLWKVADVLDKQSRALRVLRGHEGGLCGVAFSPDGRLLASASHDETVRLWGVT